MSLCPFLVSWPHELISISFLAVLLKNLCDTGITCSLLLQLLGLAYLCMCDKVILFLNFPPLLVLQLLMLCNYCIPKQVSEAQLPYSGPILCDPVDCSLPGSSVHGIFQTGILEWVSISFSRGSSPPRGWTSVSCVSCIGRRILYLLSHWEAHNCIPSQEWAQVREGSIYWQENIGNAEFQEQVRVSIRC